MRRKVAFELENPRLRASDAPAAEQAAARDAFATSVLWLGDAIPGQARRSPGMPIGSAKPD